MPELDSGIALDDFQKQFMEQAANPVPLHPELAECLLRGDPDSQLKWDALKHPLVFAVPYTPGLNFLYNQQLEAKTKALGDYLAEENWGSYVFMHERPYRFDAFEAVLDLNKLDGPKYWDLLGSVWSDSENIWQIGYRRVRRLLALHPEHRDCFMDDREKNLLQRLPDRIRVFRGHQHQNQKGFSWSLAYTTAVWFGQRYTRAGQGKVSQGVVQKSDIIGLVLGRNEMEVVVDPRHVKDLELMKPIPRSEDLMQLRRELASKSRLVGRTAHGLDHWDKVDRNAVELCRRVPEADLTVARLFAIIHDSCRHNEHSDPEHGYRAADLAIQMYHDGKLQGLTNDQFTKLEFACWHHNGHKPVSDPTIGVCFDSDRLDLLRVGIIPNPKLLSTQAARDLIGVI